MKKDALLLLCFFAFFLSCKDKVNDEKIVYIQKKDTLNIDVAEIKNLIKLQKNANYIDYRPDDPYLPTEKDLLVLMPFVEWGLKNTGYKILPNGEFENRIKELVKNNKIKKYDAFTTIFANTLDRTTNTLNEHEFDFDLTDNQFVINKYNFMIPMLFLRDVIKVNKDDSYSIAIPHNIIARNKYLFNDSKADLDWLLVNDQDFLKSLVNSLGYDKEPRINKLLLEDYYEMYNDSQPTEKQFIGTVFFTKDLNNNFCIRQGLVDYVKNNTTVNDNRFIYALSYYSFALYEKNLSEKFGSESPFKMFNDVEKAHIASVIASIEVPAIAKYKSENPRLWSNAGSALYDLLVEHPEIEDIIVKNNYFGIKNMKQVLEDTINEIDVDKIKRGEDF
ncbi:hypothetical protein [Flavobacterium johnsoniae]|uniref:Hypothetical lipoprotein n=1 Tax=Flavobacterium johnsoniae (strain ATCC 17061 / DSM 2064 / JCM 8514 / BCRC 14874 / CCUG 350202 / NBRC 14942 / NCIMB 11054 / UW101) TaxID=376686 RepID=A5FHM2_FLAJ1|nr:hypothetical protein [Flavobacterium johnsoniae]ABQ05292.1 hypothetical lipoprotein [Flavobacterium johnsoniae UW101]OXE95762.1 hypothetical protein B0A63_23560 [Flavobacterium johnsoniae UW101]WQG82906.1 hypothetical protein SR927_07225 [Flavobacterium johnsoniae UW101]SHL60956.1 hypothetical protein SAMN05444146_4213 [Flavobacterium johnsoniae]